MNSSAEEKTTLFLIRRSNVHRFTIAALRLLCCMPVFLSAQSGLALQLFPDSAFVEPFMADVNAHTASVENIILTKNVRSTIGTSVTAANIAAGEMVMQVSVGGSVRFELHPEGQAQIVSNEYVVDFVTLDIPVGRRYAVRFVSGHTSHHLSDNWFERLGLVTAVRYSRDYLRLMLVRGEKNVYQWYAGADYAYILTIGTRRATPWVFQAGGTYFFSEISYGMAPYAAADMKIRQETNFSATHVVQAGVRFQLRTDQYLRIQIEYTAGSDERGQFFPGRRDLTTIGISIDQ